jgi:hypothetical protein
MKFGDLMNGGWDGGLIEQGKMASQFAGGRVSESFLHRKFVLEIGETFVVATKFLFEKVTIRVMFVQSETPL